MSSSIESSTPSGWRGVPNLPSDFIEHYQKHSWAQEGQLPIVYHPKYNITFLGVEKLHPFDSSKFQKVVSALVKAGKLKETQLVKAFQASREQLSDVHSEEYLKQMETSSRKVAQVSELAPLAIMPNFLVQSRVVTPMQYHVGGTILAAGLAAKFGWAINLGGGMHHAYREDGMGWCPYDDIYIALRCLRRAAGGGVKRVLYVDVDAHQGNGVERDKLFFNDADLCVLDVYNAWAFPGDDLAKMGIDIPVELHPHTSDEVYLGKLNEALHTADQQPGRFDLLFYNAGTDPLQGDPLGGLSVSRGGIITRDETVWRFAFDRGIPICMVLSGGYSRQSAPVIADSISNLFDAFQLHAHTAPSM